MQQRELFVFFLPAYLIKWTSASLKEPSWMSFYKGLLAYLVYLKSLGSVHGDHCKIRDRASSIVDLEQVYIHFISENDRSASALVIGRVQAMTRR